jgi:tryptophan synthase alpha chain
MNRIDKKFLELKKNKKKALIVYLTAGDPSLKLNEQLILAFEKEGVDLMELGVPFSDPLADGPVIQEASRRALKKKVNLTKILALVKRVRKKSEIPILLMSYINPILQFGVQRFANAAKKAGVDGAIIPDLPPEEGKRISAILRESSIDLVYLIAPTSSPARMRRVAGASKGFVYYVSTTGVTGAMRSTPIDLQKNVRLAKRQTRLPVCVGFGVSTPEQARQMARYADGVIVGSAVVKALAADPRIHVEKFSEKIIGPFVKALKKDR